MTDDRRRAIGGDLRDDLHDATRWVRERWPGEPPSLTDMLLASVLFVWCLPSAGQVASYSGTPVVGIVLGLVLVALYSVPFLWRSSAPLVTTGLVVTAHLLQLLVLNEPTTGNVTAPMSVYAVARWSSSRPARRAVLAVAAAGSAIGAVDWTLSVWADPTDVSSMIQVVMLGGVCFAITLSAWLLGALVRQRAQAAQEVRDRAAAEERGRVQNIRLAAQEERARIAREMHDVVAHSLSVIVVQSDGAAYALDAALATADRPGTSQGDDVTQPIPSAHDVEAMRRALQTASAALATIGTTARESLADTRRLVAVLRQDEIGAEYAPSGGVDTLADLVDPLRAAGLDIHTDVGGERRPLPRTSDFAVYRVVQESLTNVIKHAGEGATVWVSLDYRDDALVVTVRDDGAGVTAAPDGHGHGLVGMRERLVAVGGTLWAGGAPGGGFLVEARIPYDSDGASHGQIGLDANSQEETP